MYLVVSLVKIHRPVATLLHVRIFNTRQSGGLWYIANLATYTKEYTVALIGIEHK